VTENPFRPGFGRHPSLVIGRDALLESFARFFAAGSGKQWATHLEAHRGTGKTVLLDAIQDRAAQAGWVIVQEDAGSASTGLIRRLTDRVLALRDDVRPRPKRRLTGAGVSVLGSGASIQLDADRPAASTLRGALDSLLDLEVNGLLLTIDEIHDASSSELKEVGNAAQHMLRDGRRFAIVLAGLPTGGDRGPTFLARCDHPAIGAIDDVDVRAGLAATAALGGITIDDRAMLQLVAACAGNPYMLQLVGYHAVERIRGKSVRLADAVAAIAEATGEIVDAITGRVVDALAPRERDFLVAMTRSGNPARMSDVRETLGVSSQYANVYRTRLIKQGLVRPAGHGLVEFGLPGIGELLA
jgi:hypothetical protein